MTRVRTRNQATREQCRDAAVTRFTGNVTRIMQRQGVSQTELGRRLDINQTQVSRILNKHKDIRISTVELFAKALGRDPKDFFIELPSYEDPSR